ncbi:hypothetical protein [uncultured Thiodictyon sp.]|uniref:hypothetical protein n=1 Tax=uncultured Thiodictyon sp. TaxID=1846217 RepID=UPI0025CEF208|nr:hypothetical protein [uncultured Thiodictyon sp.]
MVGLFDCDYDYDYDNDNDNDRVPGISVTTSALIAPGQVIPVSHPSAMIEHCNDSSGGNTSGTLC